MKFLDVNQHLSELDEHIKVLKSYGDVFEEVEARITRVINMDGAFKGEGAQGVINNHAHVQLPTIRSIRAFLISYAETLEKMKANITEYEPASNGSVSEDFWKNQLPKGYDRYEEKLEEREATINQATAEVSHILHLGKLQTGDVYNSIDSARKHADTVLEGLYDLDQAGVELMAQVRTKMEELKATIRQVLDWTVTGGVTMKGVSIMEVGGYFANNATLHEKAPEVDTSKVSVGVYDPALADNPSLVQWTADLFDKASTMNNVYTVADAGMQAGNYAFQAAMRLDAKYGNPVSNGVLNMSIQSHYFLQMGMVRGQEMIHSGMIKGQQAMNNRLASVANSPIAAKMNAFSAHMMTDPRLVYSNYYLNQARAYGSQAMNGVRHYGAQALGGMKQLGNQGMTMLTNTNQWFQGKLPDIRASVNGIASTVANNKAVKGVVNFAKNGRLIPGIGHGISIIDNSLELVRQENSEKTGWEKAGRVAGGLALDFAPVAVGAGLGAIAGPPGAAIGAAVGFIATVGIAWGNLATGGAVTEWARDKGETAMRKVGETVDAAKQKVDDFVSGVGNAIESGKQAVEKAGKAIAAGKKAADAIGDFFSGAGDFIAGFGR